jgi:hypothetical protein
VDLPKGWVSDCDDGSIQRALCLPRGFIARFDLGCPGLLAAEIMLWGPEEREGGECQQGYLIETETSAAVCASPPVPREPWLSESAHVVGGDGRYGASGAGCMAGRKTCAACVPEGFYSMSKLCTGDLWLFVYGWCKFRSQIKQTTSAVWPLLRSICSCDR